MTVGIYHGYMYLSNCDFIVTLSAFACSLTPVGRNYWDVTFLPLSVGHQLGPWVPAAPVMQGLVHASKMGCSSHTAHSANIHTNQRHSLPQSTSHYCISPRISKSQWTLSVRKILKLTISIVLPGFLLSPYFLAITFVSSKLYGWNFAQFRNFKPPHVGENLEMIMYIFLILAHTTPC